MGDTLFAHGAREVPNRFSRRPQFQGVQSPSERFLLPVCLTMLEYEMLMGVIMTYNPDVWFRVLEATHFVNRPELTFCGGGENCEEAGAGCCEAIAPDDPRVEIRPANPITDPDEVPEGYTSPPFYVVTSGGEAEAFGAQAGDILTTFDRLPSDPISLLQLGLTDRLPTIAIKVEGEGTLSLNLLKVPQGGIAIVEVDDDYSSLFFVDMSSADLLELDSYVEAINFLLDAFTGERLEGSFINSERVDIRLEGDGEHEVEIIFWPKLDIDNFVGWGGGFHSADWCPDNAVRPTPETCPPPRVYQDADGCIYWYDPIIRNERRICPPDFVPNPFSEDSCCCCCCCCEGEYNMCCNCGSGGGGEARRPVYYDEALQSLAYFSAQGIKTAVPPSAFTQQPLPPETDDPDDPNYEEPSGDNACFKAHGAWAAIEEFAEAYFDILSELEPVSTNPVTFVARWRQSYPHLAMDSFELAAVPLNTDNQEQVELEASWDNKKAIIKDRFICAAQYRFAGNTRITDSEFRWVEDYQFDQDDQEIGDILEALVNAMKSEYMKLRSYEFVVAQEGQCLCEGGNPPDDDASPTCSVWGENFRAFAFTQNDLTSAGMNIASIRAIGTAPYGENHAGLLKAVGVFSSQFNQYETRAGAIYSLEGDIATVDLEGFTLLYRVTASGNMQFFNIVIGFGSGEEGEFQVFQREAFGGGVVGETGFITTPNNWAGQNGVSRIYIGLLANGPAPVNPTIEILGLTLDYRNPQNPPLSFRQEICP